MTNAQHSAASSDWYTPAPLVDAARELMGGIDLDPASDEEANRIVRADRYYGVVDNGLKQPWSGRVFLNPPGGLVEAFWKKTVRERRHFSQLVWIGYSLQQLQTLQTANRITPLRYPLCFPARRIAFVENETKQQARLAKLVTEGEAPGASREKRAAAAAIRAGKIPPSSPTHSNYIAYVGTSLRVEAFATIFARFGTIVIPR